ncbi:uncharacterized protein A4U43_C05F16490 [Asparagus officinalis]|uniref:Uncharacterized protein n=1 Tax=Asparagus officinalis TaxID=4686 RepID=A0A5P1ET39_ASPOF|nr:uncharacterized protein A4U43_C05F16490 [Asparagus officinalis]
MGWVGHVPILDLPTQQDLSQLEPFRDQEMPTFAPDLPASLKSKRGVGVGASGERAAKRARHEEVAIDADIGVIGTITGSILSASMATTLTLVADQQALASHDQALVSKVHIPSNEEEEEEEPLDYSSEGDTDSYHSPDIDSLVEDLETTSPLPAQEPTVTAPCGVALEVAGEWSSLLGATRVGVLASP